MHTSGIILKLSGNKTIKVLIRKKAVHSLYKKVVWKKTTLLVHNNDSSLKLGDLVSIKLTRPKSKFKSWEVCYNQSLK